MGIFAAIAFEGPTNVATTQFDVWSFRITLAVLAVFAVITVVMISRELRR